jgi:CRP-like cAMP-binding protein
MPDPARQPTDGDLAFRLVTVLDADRDLADVLSAQRLAAARPLSVASAYELQPRPWRAEPADLALDGYGLLLLDGLLIRRTRVGGRSGAELLGAGDLLQPAVPDDDGASVEPEASWQVLAPATLAVLDRRWMLRMTPFPEIAAALTRRSLERLQRLLATTAIGAERRLDARLCMLLWHLAERYGRVHADGVHLTLPLTHEILGELSGARRPSVSSALARLVAEGRVRRDRAGWVLTRGPMPG